MNAVVLVSGHIIMKIRISSVRYLHRPRPCFGVCAPVKPLKNVWKIEIAFLKKKKYQDAQRPDKRGGVTPK